MADDGRRVVVKRAKTSKRGTLAPSIALQPDRHALGWVHATKTIASRTMHVTLSVLLTVLFALSAPTPAHADCADFPQPGVEWRRCLHDGSDLSGVDLTGAEMRDASFKRANLNEAVLNEVEATRAKFVSATMVDAQLEEATFTNADFTRADLTGASFEGASLRRARFFHADLTNADLSGATLDGVDFLHANLSGATWTDGETVCAEGSIGRCKFERPPQAASH